MSDCNTPGREKGRELIFAGVGLALLFLTALPALSVTIDDYRARVARAKEHVSRLLETVARAERGPRETSAENELVGQIKRDLPDSEKIEWPGGLAVTENSWLSQDLDAFLNEDDTTGRAVILTGANERLGAIARSAEELQKAAATDATKDRDKQKLGEILQREEYQKPQEKEESLFARLMRVLEDWLAQVFPRPAAMPAIGGGFGSLKFVLQIVIYSLVIGLLGFLIYRFLPGFARRRASKTKKEKADRVILGERVSGDASASDLFDEAERLALEGNLRAAIRKGYIALLCELSDRKVIGLARHKTNRDYLRDVRKRADLFENMNGLTFDFERNWYGLRPAVQQDWEDFRDRYRQTIARV